ncbi:MAG: hypothetical protein CSB44_07430 [Gammaproteobacteria bacterium]|nr:MAG: hypothetical protein CSB44_07430 [Gammaproteobacteria bacterium]
MRIRATVLAVVMLSACASTTFDVEDEAPASAGSSDGNQPVIGFSTDVQRALREYDADIRVGQYDYKRVNLNNDSWPDAVALMHFDSGYCGNGGCTLMVLTADPEADGTLRFTSDTTLVKLPVVLSDNRTNGFHDIVVQTSGGGYPARKVTLVYDGSGYTANASMASTAENVTVREVLLRDESADSERPKPGSVVTLSGLYVYGHEVSVLTFGSLPEEYWAVGEADVMDPLRKASLDKAEVRHSPYQPVLIEARVRVLPPAEDGFAESHDGLVEILDVRRILPEKDSCEQKL